MSGQGDKNEKEIYASKVVYMELSHTFSNSVKQPTISEMFIRSFISIFLFVIIGVLLTSPLGFIIIKNGTKDFILFILGSIIVTSIVATIINIIFLYYYLSLMKIKGDFYFTINDGKISIRTKSYNYYKYEYELFLNQIEVLDIKTINKCKNIIGLSILLPWRIRHDDIISLHHPAANLKNLYFIHLKSYVPITYSVYQQRLMSNSDVLRQYQNDFYRTSSRKEIILDIPDINRFKIIVNQELKKRKIKQTDKTRKKKVLKAMGTPLSL